MTRKAILKGRSELIQGWSIDFEGQPVGMAVTQGKSGLVADSRFLLESNRALYFYSTNG